ncbi:MAG TPA: DNA polymerase III subunit gamma/tau [Candidatus Acidoferrales bacterium]|nr:DNA polymerase III subunit gamma/tau [Candidatus Acidoferrales bacterium]
MSYQVIARKWRPQTFADVVGQQHVTRTLSNAIQSGRVAHAYIFSGARGVGKTTTARILAKALNCAKGPAGEPCNECDSCREIGLGNSLDVIEIDAASNRGIDQIRELREMVRYAPAGGRFKVVILDEAHMLTSEASNALLKTLEEPPDKVIFVMATTEPENLADTIRSRSQHFHFRALSFAEISDALNDICAKEGLTAELGAIGVMARAAEGSLRDGLSLLEQARAYCGSNITDAQVRELLGVVPGEILDELTGAIEERSAERVLALVHRLLADGQNLQHFCREAIGHFRNLLVARVCGADSELIAAPADERPRLKKFAEFFSEEDLTRFFQILLHTDEDLRRKPDARLHLEMGLLRMVNAARLAPLEEVLAELDGGTPAAPAPVRSSGASASATPSITPKSESRSLPAEAAGKFGISQRDPSGSAGGSQEPIGARTNASGAAAAAAPARVPAPAAPRAESMAPVAAARVETNFASPQAGAVAVAVESEVTPPNSVAQPAAASVAPADAPDDAKVESIKNAIVAQEKFLGELVTHASRWELSGNEVRLFFSTENRALAELLQGRDPMERLRNVAGRILGHTVRVCVKLEAVQPGAVPSSGTRELRAQFEQDPIVRAMLERFGGRISDVKRRGEE